MGRRPRDPADIARERNEKLKAILGAEFERSARVLYEREGIDVDGAQLVFDDDGQDPASDGWTVRTEYHWEWPDGRRYPPLPDANEG